MIIAPLAGFSLAIAVAVGPVNGPQATSPKPPLTLQNREAAVQPLVRSATECIARRVLADPRFAAQRKGSNLGDLIVESMPACAPAVRAMIDACDRYYGTGAGEAFFKGPYLDILPTAVTKWVKELSR
jgi:hypothetical protein